MFPFALQAVLTLKAVFAGFALLSLYALRAVFTGFALS
jgi:hypothetical protein